MLKPIEGTILTVVRESADGAREAAAAADPWPRSCGPPGTPGGSRSPGRPTCCRCWPTPAWSTPGEPGFLLLLDSALHVVDGEPLPEPPEDDGAGDPFQAVAHRPVGGDGELDVSEQRYEVMFLCDLADASIGSFKQRWGDIGDSIVVVGGDGTWNCHVHTNDIGAAIETVLDLDGRPYRIRVTDLFEEVAAEHALREAALQGARPAPELPAVTCAVVAVSSGPGIDELFRELGVQVVVGGGQTLNPSTAELLAAVDAVNAEQVIVLPGNKNIIPVAEQLDALTAAHRARRAHPVDARGARRADGLRPRGAGRGQHRDHAQGRRGHRRRRGHAGGAGQPDRRRSRRRG